MMARLLRIVSGRLWLILPTIAAGCVAAVAIQTPDRAAATWSLERTKGYDVGPTGRIANLLFSPDGRTILDVSNSGTRLREATTGRVIANLARCAVHFPTFFDGGRLLAGQLRWDSDSITSVKVWEVATGLERASFSDAGWIAPHRHFTTSRVGGVLAFDEGPGPIEVDYRVWDVASGLNPRKFPGHRGPGYALTPDGRSLITGVQDASYTLTEWDVATGRSLGKVDHPPNYPSMLLFADDGRLLVGSFVAEETCLIDRKTGANQRIPMAVRPDRQPSFGGDGRLLVGPISLDWDEGFDAVDLLANPPRALKYHDVASATPDGRRTASLSWFGGESGSLADPARGNTVNILEGPQRRSVASIDETGAVGATLGPDGRRVAILVSKVERTPFAFVIDAIPWGSLSSRLGPSRRTVNAIKVLDVDSGRQLASIPIPDNDPGLAVMTFSPDGDQLAVESVGETEVKGSADAFPWTVAIWHVPARRPWGLAGAWASASGLVAMAFGRWLDGLTRRGLATTVPT